MTATASLAAPGPRIGRPTLFTPERCALLLDCLRKGYKRKLACAKAGVAYDTFNTWLATGESEPESPFCQFRQEVHEAETEGRAQLVDSWLEQTRRDWKAAAKYLAIVDPDEYSEQRQLRVTHSGTVLQVQVQVPTLAISQVAGLLGLAEEPIDAQAMELPDGAHTGTAGL